MIESQNTFTTDKNTALCNAIYHYIPVGSDCLAQGSSRTCNPRVSTLFSGLVT